MTSYSGRHAELYDLFYAEKPYADEAAFVAQCLQRFGKGVPHRLLELACGTGNHALNLAKLGFEITATDYSKDMLACARRKAVENPGEGVDFQFQDMRSLHIEKAPFDAAYALFDSIGYVSTNEGMQQVFEGVKAHLKPGALFIFEFWHAAAMLREYEHLRVRRWDTADGQVMRLSETTLHIPEQTAHVQYTIYELRKNGTFSCLEETQINRYFLLAEMQNWLSSTGFTALKFCAGFSFEDSIDEHTWHIVAVAKRNLT